MHIALMDFEGQHVGAQAGSGLLSVLTLENAGLERPAVNLLLIADHSYGHSGAGVTHWV